MKKNLLLCVIAALLLPVQAQVKFFPKNENLGKWYTEYPNHNLKSVSRKLMQFQEVKDAVAKWDGDTSAMLGSFHWLDFDRDLCPDILFNGKIGNRDYTFLFKNTNDSIYTLLLELPGQIIQANSPSESMPLSISIYESNCCGDKVSYFTRWTCVKQAGVSFMQKQEQGLVYAHTLLPDAGSQVRPKARFELKNYVSLLRMTPFIDDDTYYDGVHNWRGNYIVKYPQGSTGVIFHEITNNDGKWYFVRMNNGPQQRLHSDRFLHSEEVENPHLYYYYGWIHEGNVEILNQ